ncbi:MAG: hypothetical protein Q9174_005171 [Haloplaca sp. 1 TL-2023]
MVVKAKTAGEAYDNPDDFQNLDELAAPPPLTRDNVTPQASLEHPSGDTTTLQGHRDTSVTEQYDLPNDYRDLDEVKAPNPVANPDVERSRHHLEDQRHSSTLPSQTTRNPATVNNQVVPEHAGSPSPSANGLDQEKSSASSRRQKPVSRLLTEVYTVSHLIFFSILGTLARLGLQALTSYPGAPVQTPVLWANVAGSLLLGFLAEDRQLFSSWIPSQAHPDGQSSGTPKHNMAINKKIIPLYIGLSTGFCSSLTSFSSFIRDAFLALANELPVPVSHTAPIPIDPTSIIHRNGGYSFLALLAVIITTVSLSLSALVLGAQLALGIEPYFKLSLSPPLCRFLDRIIVFLSWGCWVGAVIMTVWPPHDSWRGRALFSIVFTPLGCLVRFYISLHLNGRIKAFPMGTFVVNIFGTAVLGVFYDLQHLNLGSNGVGGGVLGCQALQGMQDGFCGAATTVSTWVAELRGLRRRHAWVYGGISVCVGLGILVAIMGGVLWGKGWERTSC